MTEWACDEVSNVTKWAGDGMSNVTEWACDGARRGVDCGSCR